MDRQRRTSQMLCRSYSIALKRGHGFVAYAESLEVAVFNAIHLCRNAEIRTTAMLQRHQTELEVVYLSETEAKGYEATQGPTVQHSWSAWAAEVERAHLYRNELRTEGVPLSFDFSLDSLYHPP